MEETDLRYGMRMKSALEERFRLKERIRKSVLSFVRLSIYHRIHFLFTRVSALCRSHSLPHTISLPFLVSLITFLYPNCSYQ